MNRRADDGLEIVMPPQPEQLDRESQLLLYLADEMPLEQRNALEKQLQSDCALAGELDALRAVQLSVNDAIAELDQHERAPVSDGVAARRAARSIQQWQVNRLARRPAPQETKGMPWWLYPAATAAVVMIGFLVWSSQQEVQPIGAAIETKSQLEFADAEEAALAEGLNAWFSPEAGIEPDARLAQPDDVGAFFFTPVDGQENAS
jgi:hypothetical protein